MPLPKRPKRSAVPPALDVIYRYKQRLCYLLLKKHQTRQQCQKLIPRLLRAIDQLRQSGLAQPGETLHGWRRKLLGGGASRAPTAITEGLHNKMESIPRQAHGLSI
jgi:transposase